MTETGQYLLGLICLSVICFIALTLTPEGTPKKAVKLICAAAMLTAVIGPIRDFDFAAYSETVSKYKLDAEKYSDEGKENSLNLNRIYIQEQCEAYILDKAEMQNADIVSVSVEAEWSTNGYFYPVSAEISHRCSSEDKKKLTGIIEAELGIAEEDQHWRNADES